LAGITLGEVVKNHQKNHKGSEQVINFEVA
jgi:hypothetical protein